MVAISNSFTREYASAVKKARKERVTCIRLESDLYYVARKEKGHGRYLVKFFHNKTVTAVCTSVYNQACKGSWGDRCCVHIAAATLSAIRHGRKRLKLERNEAA